MARGGGINKKSADEMANQLGYVWLCCFGSALDAVQMYPEEGWCASSSKSGSN